MLSPTVAVGWINDCGTAWRPIGVVDKEAVRQGALAVSRKDSIWWYSFVEDCIDVWEMEP
jgi:hypothetical protein